MNFCSSVEFCRKPGNDIRILPAFPRAYRKTSCCTGCNQGSEVIYCSSENTHNTIRYKHQKEDALYRRRSPLLQLCGIYAKSGKIGIVFDIKI